MNIDIPTLEEIELQVRFENWLVDTGYKLEKKQRLCPIPTITIIDVSAQEAFWIGCNYVSLSHRLYDGPLTKTLR